MTIPDNLATRLVGTTVASDDNNEIYDHLGTWINPPAYFDNRTFSVATNTSSRFNLTEPSGTGLGTGFAADSYVNPGLSVDWTNNEVTVDTDSGGLYLVYASCRSSVQSTDGSRLSLAIRSAAASNISPAQTWTSPQGVGASAGAIDTVATGNLVDLTDGDDIYWEIRHNRSGSKSYVCRWGMIFLGRDSELVTVAPQPLSVPDDVAADSPWGATAANRVKDWAHARLYRGITHTFSKSRQETSVPAASLDPEQPVSPEILENARWDFGSISLPTLQGFEIPDDLADPHRLTVQTGFEGVYLAVFYNYISPAPSWTGQGNYISAVQVWNSDNELTFEYLHRNPDPSTGTFEVLTVGGVVTLEAGSYLTMSTLVEGVLSTDPYQMQMYPSITYLRPLPGAYT